MFRKQFEKKPVDACIVVLMSHGRYNTIVTKDEKEVQIWTNVITKFKDVNCPALKNKPKIFIVQACQNIVQHVDGDDGCKDMLVCMSTTPGDVSYRDQTDGSWYISKLVEVLKQDPSLEIIKVLKKVSLRTILLHNYLLDRIAGQIKTEISIFKVTEF